MPWYHKRVGEYGKRTTEQITTKWQKENRLKELEKAGMINAKKQELKRLRREERNIKHQHAMQNKILDRQRKTFDTNRKNHAHELATLARHVVDVRVSRLAKWGREDVERAHAYQQELNRIDAVEAERLRLERLREHENRKSMAHEEFLTMSYLEGSRTLPEQIMLRKSGFIEGKPRPNPKLSALDSLDDVPFHVTNRARQNLHVIELHLIQPEPMQPDSDSDSDNGDSAGGGHSEDPEDQAWLDELPPKELSVDLEKFPAAVEIKCIRLGKEGIRLLANTLAPPPPKQMFKFKTSAVSEPIEILVANLQHLNLERNNIQRMGMRALVNSIDRGAMPKLKTMNLSSNNIEDCGVRMLTDMIIKNDGSVLKHLKTLILRLNVIGDTGACGLCHVLLQTHLPHLTTLDLKMNQIKYRGAHALLTYVDSTMVRNKRFRMLNLSGNFIDRKKLGRFSRGPPKNCCL